MRQNTHHIPSKPSQLTQKPHVPQFGRDGSRETVLKTEETLHGAELADLGWDLSGQEIGCDIDSLKGLSSVPLRGYKTSKEVVVEFNVYQMLHPCNFGWQSATKHVPCHRDRL